MTALTATAGSPEPLGVTLVEGGVNVAVFARHASHIVFCLFDEKGERETARLTLPERSGDVHHGFVPGIGAGARYGLRADGPFEPAKGHRYDPAKLLVDPYAKLLDRPFRYLPQLAAPRSAAIDTAPFVPRAMVVRKAGAPAARLAQKAPPGLIYEVAVKAFSKRHPGLRVPLRGTVAALAEAPVIDHLVRLGVTHVELMPVAAWMDERHLPPLGLANAWGYNPIVFMAPDPRLAPGGPEELRNTVTRLHQAGIAVILDVVYNHSAESDASGPTVSLRGLDNAVYYRHFADDPGRLVNDTACGNTLACDRAPVLRLITDAMRHWVEATGIDGFRFDLATVLGRDAQGYSPEAPLLSAIRQDPLLREVQLIAEPWDVGEGGYRLGEFPTPFLEWNDKYRDDVRRFWRNDAGAAGALATRLAGSSDLFAASFRRPSASVNFVACHDGFALADIVAYAQKHNEQNGENNRDGNGDNHSWNNGVEGETGDAAIKERRARDRRALLATLFLSRGTPMLTAGDELGRSQKGNNNAYCQDNEITWIDWATADRSLADFVAGLMQLRAVYPALRQDGFFSGKPLVENGLPDVAWLDPSGRPLRDEDWATADIFVMAMACSQKTPCPQQSGLDERLCVVFNRSAKDASFILPDAGRTGWNRVLDSAAGSFDGPGSGNGGKVKVAPRSVTVFAPAE
ncbi:glycogen operon protein [Rhizobiales bacterium GAS113]|nr:glycogen operon protein [Rhizobiales bacterium GAS113]